MEREGVCTDLDNGTLVVGDPKLRSIRATSLRLRLLLQFLGTTATVRSGEAQARREGYAEGELSAGHSSWGLVACSALP